MVDSITILGKGFSLARFTEALQGEAPRHITDETWAINEAGIWCQNVTDKLWMMDNFEYVKTKLPWLANHVEQCEATVVTSKDFTQEHGNILIYPFEEIKAFLAKTFVSDIFWKNTLNYALAYALFTGVTKIVMYGVDLQDNLISQTAAMSIMVGFLAAKGVEIILPDTIQLYTDIPPYYGYNHG